MALLLPPFSPGDESSLPVPESNPRFRFLVTPHHMAQENDGIGAGARAEKAQLLGRVPGTSTPRLGCF